MYQKILSVFIYKKALNIFTKKMFIPMDRF